ncbi:GcrA cell cycle regulator [Aurantimonas aggregata]|uniref:GcrA cell cycle regulator n=1 Tax=Aurantimonas aggregata TaxID=2047720 RepID=A0A6L9MHL0_9HYPH|nr:GcrA family cell cycle regulator [Aurantimonas aggregata]NDV87178.1 GcrA cell cycle regulator [Aurantimonas aggregata]
MGWTDERVALLKQLWTEGLSASQIADRLGGVTRNAVIGKVHRLKLESRAKAPATLQTHAAEPQPVRQVEVETVEVMMASRFVASQAASAPRAMPRSMGATALKIDHEEELEVLEEPRRQSGEVVPIARKLTLVQLNERTCKWPVGDPLKPDFHFCGNNSKDASPYCQYHAKMAFQPVSDRRRAR